MSEFFAFFESVPVIRGIIGFILVLFIPGFAWTLVFFKQLNVIERIALSFGLSIAVVLGFGIYKGSLRISMKALFKWTSIFLILFAAGMVAYGIHELQEAGLLLIGPIEVWNINPPLLPDGGFPLLHEKGLIGGMAKALFGYSGNPSALEIIAYVAYLGIAFTYLWVKQKGTNQTLSKDSNKVTLTTNPA